MKRILTALSVLALAAGISTANVIENFDFGFSGWSNDGVIYTSSLGTGIGGSGALDYSTTATSNKGAIHPTSVTGSGPGHTVTVSSYLQYGLNGTGIADTTASNVNGINKAFIGLRASTTANFWDGINAGMELVRRDLDQIWGIKVPAAPWTEGWNNNTVIGFPDNAGSAATSGWFKMELVLTDTGGATYDQHTNVYAPGGALAMATASYPTGIPVGSAVYGGYWNGWDLGTNTVEEQSKVNLVLLDDFSLTATVIPEPSSMVMIGIGLAGFALLRRR